MVDCPYCGRAATLTDGRTIYPSRPAFWDRTYWLCAPCQAWVGCHPHTTSALGTLANAQLRRARMLAHEAFDPIWREGGMSRGHAYQWLARKMGVKEVHIGKLDEEGCAAVVQLLARETRHADNRRKTFK